LFDFFDQPMAMASARLPFGPVIRSEILPPL